MQSLSHAQLIPVRSSDEPGHALQCEEHNTNVVDILHKTVVRMH